MGAPLTSAPTDEEAPGLLELQALLADEIAAHLVEHSPPWEELVGEIRLLRFLRGHDGNAGAAAASYKKMLHWRAAEGVDAIREDIVAKDLQLDWSEFPRGNEVAKLFPMALNCGSDEHGHIVQCENTGMVDANCMDELGDEAAAVIKNGFKYMLECRNLLHDRLSRKTGQMIMGVHVRDMGQAGVNVIAPKNVAMAKFLGEMAQDNYPETQDRILFTNAPVFMRAIMAIAKPLLGARTLSKFVVMPGADPAVLLGHTNLRTLQHLAQFTDKLREETVDRQDGGVCKTTGTLAVGARRMADRPMALAAGATVSWSWSVASHDVNFEASFVDSSGPQKFLPSRLVSARKKGEKSERGEFTAPEGCLFTLTWDNTNSRMRGEQGIWTANVDCPSPCRP